MNLGKGENSQKSQYFPPIVPVITDDDIPAKDIDDITAKILMWCSANKLSLNDNKTENLKFSLNRRYYSIDNTVKFVGRLFI